MKKVRLIVAFVLVFAFLSSCAHKSETVVKSTFTPALDRILQRKELVVGTAGSMPPLNMTTKQGKVIGLEPDLARSMASAMGVKLKLEVMPFSELLPALEERKIDIILSGMTITPSRNLKVAFVGPYFISGKAFLTKIDTIASAEEATEVDSPNTRLAALRGSTSQFFVEKVLPKVKLTTTKDYDEAVKLVLEDKVDAMIADYPICIVSVFRYPEEGLLSVITPLTYEPLGIAMPATDPHLINWAENFLNGLEATGKLEELKDRWFADGSWLQELP